MLVHGNWEERKCSNDFHEVCFSHRQLMRSGLHNESRLVTNVEPDANALMQLKSQQIITEEEIMMAVDFGMDVNQRFLLEASWKDEFNGSDDMCEESENFDDHFNPEFDQNTGGYLDPVFVKKGCQEEMNPFKVMKVYEYVLRGEANNNSNQKFVWVRWAKVNKGTVDDPNIRCRLVAQEFAKGEERDDLFAGTLPHCML